MVVAHFVQLSCGSVDLAQWWLKGFDSVGVT